MPDFPARKVKDGIYRGLSKYTHGSYVALLDSVDVFKRDFDFDKTAGFHYTNESSIPYMKTLLSTTIITLKQFYQSVKDNDSYQKLDIILKEDFGEVDKEEVERNIKEVIERYK